MCGRIFTCLWWNYFIVQENSLEDEDVGFQDKDIALEDETEVEEIEQSKEITAKPPKDLQRELRKYITLL